MALKPDLWSESDPVFKFIDKYGPWAEIPNFPKEDWQTEVRYGDTFLGYHDWVRHQLKSNPELGIGTPKYTHTYSIAFTVDSMHPAGEDVDTFLLRQALLKRINDSFTSGSLIEACGAPEVTENNWEDSDV